MWEQQTKAGHEKPLFQSWTMIISTGFVYTFNFVDSCISYPLKLEFIPKYPYTLSQVFYGLAIIAICTIWIVLFIKLKGPKPLKIIGSVITYVMCFYIAFEQNIKTMTIDKSIIS